MQHGKSKTYLDSLLARVYVLLTTQLLDGFKAGLHVCQDKLYSAFARYIFNLSSGEREEVRQIIRVIPR